MTRLLITKFRIFTISRIRRTSCNIKIRNLFIEIKYSITDRFVIFITDRGNLLYEMSIQLNHKDFLLYDFEVV